MADLKIKIKGDNSSLNKALKSSESKLDKFSSGVRSFAASGAGIALSGIAAGFAAVGAAAFAAFSFITPLANQIDGIGKSSKRIGITTDEFQSLAFAARRTGASTETVERAFKRMQKTITDAGKGLKTAKDAIAAVGFEFKDLEGLSPEKQFEKIGNRISLIEDATLRAAISQEIFGRAGTNIAPLINEYGKLKKELVSMNGVIDKESVKAAEDYADALENLATQAKALAANSGAIEKLSTVLENVGLHISAIQKNPSGSLVDILMADTPSSLVDTIRRQITGEFIDRNLIPGAEGMVSSFLDSSINALTGGKSERELANEAAKGFTSGGGASKLLSSTSSISDKFLAQGSDITGAGGITAISIQDQQLSELKEIKESMKMFTADGQRTLSAERQMYWDGEVKNLFRNH